MKIILAYKKEYFNLLSEEDFQKNKIFLEERYESLVEKNQDRGEAEMFKKRISKIEEMGQEFFEDGLYISGKLLRRFKAKIETSSEDISCEASSKMENYLKRSGTKD